MLWSLLRGVLTHTMSSRTHLPLLWWNHTSSYIADKFKWTLKPFVSTSNEPLFFKTRGSRTPVDSGLRKKTASKIKSGASYSVRLRLLLACFPFGGLILSGGFSIRTHLEEFTCTEIRKKEKQTFRRSIQDRLTDGPTNVQNFSFYFLAMKSTGSCHESALHNWRELINGIELRFHILFCNRVCSNYAISKINAGFAYSNLVRYIIIGRRGWVVLNRGNAQYFFVGRVLP